MQFRRCRWNAVAIVADGEDAGVEREAFLHQNVQRPQGVARNGKSRSAIHGHGQAKDVFKHLLGTPQIVAKLRGCLVMYSLVPVAVRANLVSRSNNPPYQIRKAVGDPPEHKKRCQGLLFGEDLKNVRLASISPVTTATLAELGLRPATEAKTYTLSGLVDAILAAEAADPSPGRRA